MNKELSFFRSPAADFLVGGGPSKTWLLGNSLVTITTSGPGGGVQGVCPRCKAIRRSLQPDPSILLVGNESYNPTPSSQKEEEPLIPSSLCSCWCRGWAEVKIRRPTGNVAWLMRIQNKLDILATPLTGGSDDYDWSLLGLSNDIIEEEEEEEEEDGWGIITADNELHESIQHSDQQNEEQIHVPDQPPPNESHEEIIINESHDDLSHNISPDLSNGKSHDESHDLSHDQSSRDHSSHVPVNVKRQPTSHSWSERGVVSTPKAPPTNTRSYSLSVPLEHLPPLFSYDEVLGRSPSLVSDLLTDPEQVHVPV